MTKTAHMLTTTQVYRVYIKATAEAIWTAITDPDWTDRYGYTGRANYELRPGGRYWVNAGAEFRAEAERRGTILADVIIDGEVIEADPPRKLVTTFRMLMDEQMAAEGFSRITYEIKEIPGGVCSLTVIHELENTPTLARLVSGSQEEYGAGGGHAWVLSDLKSLLETGKSFAN